MLDTNTCLSFELPPLDSPPMGDDMEKAGLKLDLDPDRQVYHSLKEGGRFWATQNCRFVFDMTCFYASKYAFS